MISLCGLLSLLLPASLFGYLVEVWNRARLLSIVNSANFQGREAYTFPCSAGRRKSAVDPYLLPRPKGFSGFFGLPPLSCFVIYKYRVLLRSFFFLPGYPQGLELPAPTCSCFGQKKVIRNRVKRVIAALCSPQCLKYACMWHFPNLFFHIQSFPLVLHLAACLGKPTIFFMFICLLFGDELAIEKGRLPLMLFNCFSD